MLGLKATLLALVCTALPSYIQAQQLPFAPHLHQEQLVRLSWPSRSAAEEAVAWLDDNNFDVWSTTPQHTTLRLSPSQHEQLSSSHLSPSALDVLLPSIADHLDSTTLTPTFNLQHSEAAVANLSSTRLQALDDPIHDSYHSLDALYQILRRFEEEFSDYAHIVKVGESAEGKDILGLKVTNQSYTPTVSRSQDDVVDSHFEDSDGIHALKHKKHKIHKKLGFVVAGGQHAREWIAPSVVLYLIHDLLLSTVYVPYPSHSHRTYSRPTAAHLLDTVEFTFIPTLNPDGYSWTWATEGDRLWRKNRQPTGDGCYGVDMNRNWGFKWASGSRPNPCSDAYAGEGPFESPELRAVRDYLLEKKNNVKGFLDVHSFGQMIMFPFSYSCSRSSPDEENHFEGVVWAAKALRAVHGKNFEVGSVCEVSLTAPGDSIDWTYAVGKIRWSFSVELRGGIFGFLLPPAQIRPSGEEMSAAFVALADYVVRKEEGQRFDIAREKEI
ncbi:hypothetical protein BCR35DRAFT_277408 [Leucosporidium creatinivorum]|uniref:Inactive metallocarboxypeptidase ECM14 n=1 Tax=Leucosporidium creatinivorum TaxID=106004 RepID=A0A1Y2FW27_9BASI|nr:hypothetical protein BCR35DRAFT_277408 [Leucosporidium creatinivorum]